MTQNAIALIKIGKFICIFYSSIVNGQWGDWSGWTACSVTCGDGVKNKTRSCDDPAPAHGGSHCTGNGVEMEACNDKACPGKQVLLALG